MATLGLDRNWHSGEEEIHRLLRVPHGNNPTYPGLAPNYYHRITNSPLVAFGTLDSQGRPWTTLWGGEAGFCRPIANNFLGVNTKADGVFDPVLQELFAVQIEGSPERQIVDERLVKPEGGKVMAALSIDLETRDRVKVAGRFAAGAVVSTTSGGEAELQLAFQVQETLGNCPKYLNKKHIMPHSSRPILVSKGAGFPLPEEAVDLLGEADLFFISSKHGNESMDVNHRGGPPGLIRLFRNAPDGVTLVFPEYSGNRLYQTLGNLHKDPVAGMVVPNFANGNVLYLTGRTTILIDEKATAYLPHTKLAVKFDVDEARFVKDGLPFRGTIIDYSPYNPPVRRLISEQQDASIDSSGPEAIATATLIQREIITPSIARLVFKLTLNDSALKDKLSARQTLWLPGQHVTLDFGPELDHGWSHMREDDPQSLNDDFVRTFTISTPPSPSSESKQVEMEITVRKHGPATGLLWRWNLKVPLEVPVMGFGGSEGFQLPYGLGSEKESIFVAGGVGITPLMAQAKRALEASKENLKLLWTLRSEDIPLAKKILEQLDGLGKATKLFVTGKAKTQGSDTLKRLRECGVSIEERRIRSEDILGVGEKGKRKYYCCTGTALMAELAKWLEDEDMISESFNY